jgi:polyphosphate kinase
MHAEESTTVIADAPVPEAPAEPVTPRQPVRRVPRAVSPREVPDGAELDHPSLYFNRELGLLDFNWRVLHQATDPRVPLLERVRFLAITSSNLDEFFQKRVGGLRRQIAAGVQTLSLDGRTPGEQLQLIADAGLVMYAAMSAIWERELVPLLRTEAGVLVSRYTELDERQRAGLDLFFREQFYPVLTPLAVDPGTPSPSSRT